MNSKMINRVESFNEFFLLVTSYFMFLFTDFVGDVTVRHTIGSIFLWMMSFIIGINILMIMVEFGFGIRKMLKKRKHDKEWAEYNEHKFVLVETIIQEIGKNKTDK